MSRMSWSSALFTLGILCESALHAQTPRVEETRIGVIGGINFATFGGEDSDASLESKLRFVGGGSWVRLRPGAIGFEVDVLYSMKGSKSTATSRCRSSSKDD
jgi:hypothetical protein